MALLRQILRIQIPPQAPKSLSYCVAIKLPLPPRTIPLSIHTLQRNNSTVSSASSTPKSADDSYKAYEQLGGRYNTPHTEDPSQDEQDQEQYHQNDHATTEDEQRFKSDLLQLALSHVNTVGWSREAIYKAAAQAELSPAVASMFRDVDLVHYFISKSNEQLEEYLSPSPQVDGAIPTPSPSLQQALEWRLQKVAPYASNYSQALALLARPEHVGKSVGLLLDIADSIAHHALKDSSTDLNWYSKRMGIAGIFVATELCLVQDKSEGLSETWKFLERRCQEFQKYGKGQLPFSSVPLPELLGTGFTTFMNIIGRNPPR